MENIKQNTLKYKILFILSFIFLILLLFNTNVFASYEVVLDDTVYYLPDWWYEKEYRFINIVYSYTNNSGVDLYNVFFACSDSSFEVYKDSSNNYVLKCINDSSFKYFDMGSSSSTDFSSRSYSEAISHNCNNPSLYYTNYDIYNSSNELVFQQPAQGVLAQVLEKEIQNNPKMVLVEIQKVLILIIAVVVSLLGFRKAWKILRTSLNQS